jgi:tetratricopeptide (TPR) repeat protein|tara:strand:+ start:10939 stop:12207 length:1269 start_codon:yes stop_codon:yes gene_type:complete
MEADKRKIEEIVNLYENNDFKELNKACEKFLSEFPNSPLGWNLYALSFKNLGNLQKAMKIYENLISENPQTPTLMTNLANIYSDIGRQVDAEKLYKKAIKLDPKSINAINGLGMVYQIMGKLEESIRSFSSILDFDMNNKYANFNLAESYRKIGKYDEAIDCYSKAENPLSKSHMLECIYRVKDKNFFTNQLSLLNQENELLNPLMSCIISHASIRYDESFDNPFCNDPIDYIRVSDITENDHYDINVINQIINIQKTESIDDKPQPLLNGGKQTSGNLFKIKNNSIQKIEMLIMEEIDSYKSSFRNSGQGFILNWPKKYELLGWIVDIKEGGKLKPHMHKQGWLSGSMYLKVDKDKSEGGDILFTLDGAGYPNDGKKFDIKKVNVEENKIILFPSSIFHYTTPFEGRENRVTLAFDIKPID